MDNIVGTDWHFNFIDATDFYSLCCYDTYMFVIASTRDRTKHTAVFARMRLPFPSTFIAGAARLKTRGQKGRGKPSGSHSVNPQHSDGGVIMDYDATQSSSVEGAPRHANLGNGANI